MDAGYPSKFFRSRAQFLASSIKFSSFLTVREKSSTIPAGLKNLLSEHSFQAAVKQKPLWLYQIQYVRGICGLWTLTTTSRPSISFALWTCAIEAAAMGISSRLEYRIQGLRSSPSTDAPGFLQRDGGLPGVFQLICELVGDKIGP